MVPAVAAILIHLRVIWNTMQANPGDVALGAGIFLIAVSFLTGVFSLLILSFEYGDQGLDREPDMAKLAALIPLAGTLVLAASTTLVAVHEAQHPLTGTAIGLMAGGTATALLGAVTALLESATQPSRKRHDVTRLGQQAAMAGAALVTTGILIMCRTQIGL